MSILRDNAGNPISQDNPLPTQEANQAAQKQVGIYYHESQAIQTHNAVSVGASGSSAQTSWMDCNGYDKLACTFLNDASTSSWVNVYWSNDGSTLHGFEAILNTATQQQRTGILDIKARYAKIVVGNADAVSHTMSSWVFLKA